MLLIFTDRFYLDFIVHFQGPSYQIIYQLWILYCQKLFLIFPHQKHFLFNGFFKSLTLHLPLVLNVNIFEIAELMRDFIWASFVIFVLLLQYHLLINLLEHGAFNNIMKRANHCLQVLVNLLDIILQGIEEMFFGHIIKNNL